MVDEPTPAEPTPAPAEPAPAPVEPAAVEPTPAEPTPVEPAPAEPKPAEPALVAELADPTMPEGMQFDKELTAELKDMGKEQGWTQEQFQGVTDIGVKLLQKQADAFAETAKQWTADAKADPELGGEKFAENLALANKAIDAFASKDFVDFLGKSGLSNHPEMIRVFHKVAQAIGEDRLVSGKPLVSPGDQLPENIMYPEMKQQA